MVAYNKISSDPVRSHVSYAFVSVTLSSNVTDWSLRENTTLFSKIQVGREMVLKNTAPIFVRLNDIANDAIELFEHEGIVTVGYPIEDLFISGASGTIVRVQILGFN
jgi:hypothetical protein